MLAAWAAAYATNDGPRAAELYTEDARLWGTTSRAQTVWREAVSAYFARTRPGTVGLSVRFEPGPLRRLSPDVAVVSGRNIFVRRLADGSEQALPSRFSMTLLRGPDGLWRIADHHSSRLPAAE